MSLTRSHTKSESHTESHTQNIEIDQMRFRQERDEKFERKCGVIAVIIIICGVILSILGKIDLSSILQPNPWGGIP